MVKFSVYLNRHVFIMFLISPPLGISGRLSFVNMAFPGYLYTWVTKDAKFIHVHNEDSDQIAQMRSTNSSHR